MQEIHLLLVDKKLSYLGVAKKMLQFHDDNYEIDVATSGKECISKIIKINYDLILLDFNIDGNKGLNVLNDIVQSDVNIPIIILLDEGNEEAAFRALEQGASDYIMKVRGFLTSLPFTVGKVIEQYKTNGKTNKIQESSTYSNLNNQVTNNVEEVFFILNRRCHFISANNRLEKLFEFSEDEILALSLLELIPAEYESEFNRWLAAFTVNDNKVNNNSFTVQILTKYGNKKSVELFLDPVRKQNGEISSYKGKLIVIDKIPQEALLSTNGTFDQNKMIREMFDIINSSYKESLNYLLNRITKTICHIFKFKRATLALLDSRRDVFIKQTMIGFTNNRNNHTQEVPRDIIDKAFDDKYKVKVLYFDKDIEIKNDSTYFDTTDRRRQPRRTDNKWHPKDLVIVNLIDKKNQTFGYISLDNPEFNTIPSRDVFYNLELCANMTVLAVENYYRFSNLEKRNRRLTKQLLNTGNIFRLNQNLPDILNEFVWSIKFSLEYNLVMVGLISVNSGKIEIKSIACKDKIKAIHLKEIKFSIDSFRMLTQKQYKKGKSYLVSKKEPVLKPLKEIYYRTDKQMSSDINYWPWWAFLIIPIRSSDENKIMGFLMLDDPVDFLMPSAENIHTIEILASHISIAIENKKTHIDIKNDDFNNGINNGFKPKKGIKKIVKKFLKN